MAPRPPARGGDSKRAPLNDKEVRVLVRVVAAIANIGERFGLAFTIFVILLLAIYMMGSAQTRDDFIRELLFGSVTNTRYLTTFFVVLVLVALLGIDTKIRASKIESQEMKRLADERTAWQQRALGAPLSHTAEAEKS